MSTNDAPTNNGENDLPTGYRWAGEHEMNSPDAIVVPRTFDSTGRPYTQDEADVAVPDQNTGQAAEHPLMDKVRGQVAGMSEDEITAGMRDGSIDTGLVLGALVETGQLVIDNGPFDKLYTSEELLAQFGIDADD